MRKQSAVERQSNRPTGELTVLSVSPLDEDHSSLQAIIGHSAWKIFTAHDLLSTPALLRQHGVSVVLWERELLPGTWMDMLEHVRALPQAPSLIVTSRLADDHL